jgi:hypothetical protein
MTLPVVTHVGAAARIIGSEEAAAIRFVIVFDIVTPLKLTLLHYVSCHAPVRPQFDPVAWRTKPTSVNANRHE